MVAIATAINNICAKTVAAAVLSTLKTKDIAKKGKKKFTPLSRTEQYAGGI
jgi:hypothetical protein